MSKDLEFFILEGFEDHSNNDTINESGNDTINESENNTTNDMPIENNTTNDMPIENNTTNDMPTKNDMPTDISGNDVPTDISGNDVPPSNNEGRLNLVLTYENLYLLFWILAIYFILNSIFAFFFKRDSLGYVYDVAIIISICSLGAIYWFLESRNDTKDDAHGAVERFLKFFEDKYNTVYIIFSLFITYLIVWLFGIPNDPDTKPSVIIGLETLLFILLVLILFVQGFDQFMDVSLTEELRQYLGITSSGTGTNTVPDTNTVTNTVTGNETSAQIINTANVNANNKEVYNVGGNHYTYSDAEAICKSFDSEVADYDQIENAYNNGAEWCNYGWSKNQMALFPTQKNTWNKLQDNDKTKNNCGRPGINGGFMANPALRFGVNCYGQKPKERKIDYTPILDTVSKTPEDIKTDSEIKYWKQNQDKLKLNYYNKTRWSRS